MQGFRHCTEISADSGRKRSGDGDGISCLFHREAIESCARRCRSNSAPDRRRMESPLVQVAGLNLLQQCPDLITRYIRCDRLGSVDAERPALRQDRRREHGTGMPIHGDIVIVEGMGSDAIDEGSVGWCQVATRRDFGGALVLRRGCDRVGDELHRRLADAGNHNGDAVGHADARAIDAPLRKGASVYRHNKFGNVRR
jgi:hypothetical protein